MVPGLHIPTVGYIVLAMWASLPQYAGIEKVTERRSKLKEDIHFSKAINTLADKEDRNFAKIAKKCVSYSPERLKVIVDEGLAKYYNAENDRVILPELVLPGSETGDAAATRDHAADKGKADDKQVKEEIPTDSAAVPDNTPASEEADGAQDPMADDAEPENDSAALESAPEILGTEDREEKTTGSAAVPDNAPASEETDGAHDPVADDVEPENDSAVVDSVPEDFITEEDDIGTPSKIKRKIKLQIIAILIILVVMVFYP